MCPSSRQRLEKIILPFTVILIFLGLTFAIHYVLDGHRFGTDFYTLWRGGQEILVERISPYSMETARESQLLIKGQLAASNEDHRAFSYPLHNIFLLAPFVWLPFEWAQPAWLSFNLLIVLLVPFLVFRDRSPFRLLSLLLYYPVVFTLIMGSYPIILGLLLLVFWVEIILRKSQSTILQTTLGTLFAWSTSKPQFIAWFLVAILWYSFRMRKTPFLVSFFGSLLLMLAASWALLPGWPASWIQIVQAYAEYNQTNLVAAQLMEHFLPPTLAQPLAWIIYSVVGMYTLFVIGKWANEKINSLSIFCWLGGITYLFHPHGVAYEQMVFLIPFFLWYAIQPHPNWHVTAVWLVGSILTWGCFIIEITMRTTVAHLHPPILLYWIWFAWAYRQFPALLAAFSPARSSESLL